MKFRLFFIFLVLILSTSVFAAEPTINFPTSQDDDLWLPKAHNRWSAGSDHGKVVLDEALDDSETGIDVVSIPASWSSAGGYYIVCEMEYMYVESYTGSTLTVTRGTGTSSAAAHDTGKSIYYVLTAETIENMKDSIQAIEAELLSIPREIVYTNGSWTCDLNDDGDCGDANEVDWSTGGTYLVFDDSTDEKAYSLIYRLPADFDAAETVSVDIGWYAAATSNEVRWCIQHRSISAESEAWSSFSTAECADDTVDGTTTDLNILTDASLVESWAAGASIQLQLYRDADNVGDDLTGDAYLMWVVVKYSATVQ